ncbi:hypothetical protein FSP39_002973 [Pinctada imbricata]|uniref:DH domain-containing protein n=1 Tax=Pinctada imbricata TaxID=66713 RepID=A0AA88YH37_PINIB|nr:hypothetical protein FSP39_002973 [Pinctada imbricata]
METGNVQEADSAGEDSAIVSNNAKEFDETNALSELDVEGERQEEELKEEGTTGGEEKESSREASETPTLIDTETENEVDSTGVKFENQNEDDDRGRDEDVKGSEEVVKSKEEDSDVKEEEFKLKEDIENEARSTVVSPKILRPKLPDFKENGQIKTGGHSRSKTDPGKGSDIKAIIDKTVEDIKVLNQVDFTKTYSRPKKFPKPFAQKSQSTHASPRASPTSCSPCIIDDSASSLNRNRSRSLKILTDILKSGRGGAGNIPKDAAEEGKSVSDSHLVPRKPSLVKEEDCERRSSSDGQIGKSSESSKKKVSTGSIARDSGTADSDKTNYSTPEVPSPSEETRDIKSPVRKKDFSKFRRAKSEVRKLAVSDDEGVGESDQEAPHTAGPKSYHTIDTNSKFFTLWKTGAPKRRSGFAGLVQSVYNKDDMSRGDQPYIGPRKLHRVELKPIPSSRKISSIRHVTHPPTSKITFREDGALDSNGFGTILKSPTTDRPPPLPGELDSQASELSLADSQLGESVTDDTASFQDALESMVNDPYEYDNDRPIEKKNGKLKPKSRSDPSGEKSKENMDFPKVVTSAHSSPILSKSSEGEELEEDEGSEDTVKSEEISSMTEHAKEKRELRASLSLDENVLEKGSSENILSPDSSFDAGLGQEEVKSGVKFLSFYTDDISGPSSPRNESPTGTPERQPNHLEVPHPTSGSTSKKGIGRSASSASVLVRERKNSAEKKENRKHSLTPAEEGSDKIHSLPLSDSRVESTSLPALNKPLKDKRFHIVEELYRNEQEYVDALTVLKDKYMLPLKTSCSSVDENLVDNIFYMIPEILMHHTVYQNSLDKVWKNWDIKSTIGNVIVATVSTIGNVIVATVSTIGNVIVATVSTIDNVIVATVSTIDNVIVATVSTIGNVIVATVSTIGNVIVATVSTIDNVIVATVSTIGNVIVATVSTIGNVIVATVSTIGNVIVATVSTIGNVIVATVSTIGNVIVATVSTIDNVIVATVSTIGNVIVATVSTIGNVIVATISTIGNVIVATVSTIGNVIVATVSTIGNVIVATVSTIGNVIVATVSTIGNVIVATISTIDNVIVATVSTIGNVIVATVSTIGNVIVATVSTIGNVIVATISTIGNVIVATVSTIGNVIVATVSTIGNVIVATISTIGNVIVATVSTIGNIIVATISTIGNVIVATISTIGKVIVATVSTIGNVIVATVSTIGNVIVATVSTIGNVIVATVSTIGNVIVATVSTIGNVIVATISTIGNVIVATVSTIGNVIVATISTIGKVIVATVSTIGNVIVATVSTIGNVIVATVSTIGNVIVATVSTIGNVIVATVSTIGNVIVATVSTIDNVIVATVSTIGNVIVATVSSIGNVIVATVSTIGNVIVATVSTIGNVIVATVSTIGNVIVATVSTIGNVIVATVSTIGNVIVATVSTIDNVIVATVSTIGNVIVATVSTVGNVIVATVSTIGNVIVATVSTIGNVIVATVSTIGNVIVATVSTIGNVIVATVSTIDNVIVATVSTIGNVIVATVSTIGNVIVATVSTIDNVLVATVSTIGNIIVATVSTMDNVIVTTVSTIGYVIVATVSIIGNVIVATVSTIGNVIVATVSTIGNVIVATVSTIGNVIVATFSKQTVIDCYISFVENYKTSGKVIENALQTKSSVQKFIEQCHRDSGSKLTMKDLIVRPIQRIPRYELLIQRLIEHTPRDHPDFLLLKEAEKVMHDFAIKLGTVNETQHEEDQQESLKRLELLLITDLAVPERQYLRHDMVNIITKKDQCCVWMFSDLIIVSSVKRRSGPVTRKVSIILKSPTGQDFAENIKHKVWLRVGLHAVEIVKNQTLVSQQKSVDPEQLEDDINLLNDINDLTSKLSCPHSSLDEVVQEMLNSLGKQYSEVALRNSTADSNKLDLLVTTQERIYPLEVSFNSAEKRSQWESTFYDAKQKLAMMSDKRAPEFLQALPITKTRAGMQFSCAAPIDGLNAKGHRDVWVCNSDGYVGHMCLLSLQPEPIVTLNTPVPGCNARILCICAVPAYSGTFRRKSSAKKNNRGGVSREGPQIQIEEVEDTGTEEEEELSNNEDNEDGYQTDSESSGEESESMEDVTAEDGEVNANVEDPGIEIKPLNVSEITQSTPDSITCSGNWNQDPHKSTMWLGTEDGCIHIFQSTDNIKTTKNKLKIHHESPVYCIVYLDNKVFVSLANGDLIVYKRDAEGVWDSENPYTRSIGTAQSPITRMLAVAGKLWCGCQNVIKVINPLTLSTETSFTISSNSNRGVQSLVCSGQGVWLASQQSSKILLYHATSYEFLMEVSIAQAVSQKLQSADDIIRQHKAACLRITSLLICKDLLWIGTSAGVILTVPTPRITSTTNRGSISSPSVTGLVYGHTGHVRFLTCVEMNTPLSSNKSDSESDDKPSEAIPPHDMHRRSSMAATTATLATRMLVISGGDGYEDFRSNASNESAGRDDSTNHLLLWQV